jgi:hypothetical protein
LLLFLSLLLFWLCRGFWLWLCCGFALALAAAFAPFSRLREKVVRSTG